MKGLLPRICLILLLLAGGAIVNVSVAWGVHMWSPLSYKGGWTVIDREQAAQIWNQFRSPAQEISDSFRVNGEVCGHFFLSNIEVDIEPDGTTRFHPGEVINELQIGVPLRCMCGQFDLETDVHSCVDTTRWTWATTASTYQDLLPVYPLWPGFLINTLFYGAILYGGWVLFTSLGRTRRARRVRRGLCPKCAYPLGSSDICTECGAPRPG